MADRRGLRPRLLFESTAEGKGAGPRNRNWMLRSGGMADRRGLRPRLLFKPTPGGKGAGPGTCNWMLCSGGMADRRGLRPRLLFKATPGGKGADTWKRNWMLCSGWMDDRRGLRPRLLFKKEPEGDRRRQEPAQGTRIGCCFLVGWLTDGAFGPVCFQSNSRWEGSRHKQKELDAVFWREG
jgi:hypothetical protein